MSQAPTQWAGSIPNVKWMRQFRYMTRMFEMIHDIDGDIVECGVGEGGTFTMLAYLIGSEGKGRKLWGFDSFEGFPEPSATDTSSPRVPKKGEWKIGEEVVRGRLEEALILKQFSNLAFELVPGFFDKTLPNFPDRSIAFLHADVDIEPSYRTVLENLYQKVAKGGVILFDEYKEFPSSAPYNGKIEKWPGATKAIDEFFAGHPQTIRYWEETKKYYVIKE